MGVVDHPLYWIWVGMRGRCNNPNIEMWHRYGGRGISVCDRWGKFKNFADDMGERPAGTSLDRIDNDGNYEPGNCRWASNKEQQRNKSNAVFVVIDGEPHRVADLAELSGLKPDTIQDRANKGMSLSEVTAKTRYVFKGSIKKAIETRVSNQLAAEFCKRGHPWSEENTLHHKQGRLCKKCYRIRKGLKFAK